MPPWRGLVRYMAAWRHSAETGSALSVPASPRHAARLFAFRRRCGALFCAANLRVSSGADGAGPGNNIALSLIIGSTHKMPRALPGLQDRLGESLASMDFWDPDPAGGEGEAGRTLPPGLKIRGPSPSACALPGPLLQEDSQERRRDDEPDCHMRSSFALTAA